MIYFNGKEEAKRYALYRLYANIQMRLNNMNRGVKL